LIAFRKRTAAWNLAFQARSFSVDKLDLAPSLTGATKEPSLGDSRIPFLSVSAAPQIDVDLAQEVTKAAEKLARLISRLEGQARHAE
jgi:hypothetical protein